MSNQTNNQSIQVKDLLLPLNDGVSIPTDIEYKFKCVDETYTKSQGSGNFMVVRQLELVLPDQLEIDGVRYGLGGSKFTHYNVVNVPGDRVQTLTKMGSYIAQLKKFFKVEFGLNDELNPNNPPMYAKGKYLWFTMKNTEKPKYVPLTKEQKEEGMKWNQADAVLDPDTGEQVIGIQHELQYLKRVTLD